MEIKINDEIHKIAYIDYREDIPHQVYTSYFVTGADKPYWTLVTWDFFPNDGDKKDIRAYESGIGGNPKRIQAPQWADGYTGKYWLSKEAKLIGKPVNAIRLEIPIRVKGYYGNTSVNPFKVAEITNDRNYCEMCETESTEWCQEHKYEDEKGNERWKHNNKLV